MKWRRARRELAAVATLAMGHGENEDSIASSRPDTRSGPSRIFLLGLFVEYVFYRIDKFVAAHGLEEALRRIKEGRWALRVVLLVLAILYYLVRFWKMF